jgi:hypothetical protein
VEAWHPLAAHLHRLRRNFPHRFGGREQLKGEPAWNARIAVMLLDISGSLVGLDDDLNETV